MFIILIRDVYWQLCIICADKSSSLLHHISEVLMNKDLLVSEIKKIILFLKDYSIFNNSISLANESCPFIFYLPGILSLKISCLLLLFFLIFNYSFIYFLIFYFYYNMYCLLNITFIICLYISFYFLI